MVFFTCNACGESLKKAQVEKHVNICRGCQVLSCIDCGKDFWGEDYKNHNKCMSEDQKYGGKGYQAKTNKGDVKQQQWMQRIQEAIQKPGNSNKLREVLKQVSAYDNVPRKKAKFQNWMKNSLKISNTALHDEVWEIISATGNQATKETKQQLEEVAESQVNTKEAPAQSGQEEVKGRKKLNKRERKEARQQNNGKAPKQDQEQVTQELEDQDTTKKKKGKKRKYEEAEKEDQNGIENGTSAKKIMDADDTTDARNVETSDLTTGQASSQGKFNWKGNIKAVLNNAPAQELSLKRLRKKVLAAYCSFAGEKNFKTEEELFAIFNKKVNKNPSFRVLKDRVTLVK